MDGKAPLLLASMLFAVGTGGLLLTSVERADWGPFQGHLQPQEVIAYDAGRTFVEPPPLEELRTRPEEPLVVEEPLALVAEPQPTEELAEPEATPTPVTPLRVHGVSADGAVSAAASSPGPPRLVIGGIAAGDPEATETPEAEETPAAEDVAAE